MDGNCFGWDCSVFGQAGCLGKEGDFGDGPAAFIPSSASSRGAVHLSRRRVPTTIGAGSSATVPCSLVIRSTKEDRAVLVGPVAY
jgi:hypothetical protein